MADASYIAAAGSVIGSYFQVQGMREAGRTARIRADMQQADAEFMAWEAERRGGEALAIAQRQAIEEQRQGRYVASRALAVAAASGAGVTDPTMVRVIANARGEGAVRAANAIYEGETKARALRADAVLGRLSGQEAQLTGRQTEAAYTIAGNAAIARESMSLYSKYGLNGPKGDSALVSKSSVQYGAIDE